MLDVFGHRNASEGNAEAGALLLADLRRLFADRGAMRLPSTDIVASLEKMEERPWPEWKNGRPMTPVQLAAALAPFRVRPVAYRPEGGGAPVKGYIRENFEEAWSRYLAPPATSSAG